MKLYNLKLFALAIFLYLISINAYCQLTQCVINGPVGYSGPILSSAQMVCGGQPPTPVPPPPTPSPQTCSASQVSSSIGGKTLERQCSNLMMIIQPNGPSYSGNATDLGAVLGNTTWPSYKYRGYAATFSIVANQYIALAFTPTRAGEIQLSVNLSFGDGGIISVSDRPGSFLPGNPGLICSFSRNGANSLTIGTFAEMACPVSIGKTYYLNIADVDIAGNNLCNGNPNSCTLAQVSYTLYTSN